MEAYELVLEKANKSLKIADHMLSVTYKLVNDPKLLLSIVEHIFAAVLNGMDAVLLFERLYKRIPPYSKTFDGRVNMFREKCIGRVGLDNSFIALLFDLRSIIKEHKESPIEFCRKDKLVICSNTYRMKVLSVNEIKKYLSKAKLFIDAINSFVKK
ncbi:hypothetical protein DRZ77_02155 [Candidatus Woesearchaeota archaeon]|nr:hypothetical protein [Candidatus Woesearchaeota archaeon]RLE40475.1 MAG: hypothetical protein DRZ77_02155 [Candidatus Woesearchaeota archaeon]